MHTSLTPRRATWRTAGGIVALVLVATGAFVVDLGRPAFWDPGEGRYAQTVHEMMASGQWLVPTLNGVPYFDKPPGYYWLVAGSFHTFGLHEWAARLPSAIPALLTIAVTACFAWPRLGAATAIGSGLILATTTQFVALGRSVRMDMLLTLLLSATLFRAYALWTDDRPSSGRTWMLYALPAFGLLIKGPIAVVLPVLIVGALTALTRDLARLRRLRPGPGIAVAAIVAASWYVPTAITAPEYLRAFLWDQNVGRFVGAATGHGEPAWYFLWILPVSFLPWTFFAPAAVARACRRARRRHDLDVFLLCWIVLTVGFFSISRAKLATYVLPVFPPLALLVARHLRSVLAAGVATRRRELRVPAYLTTVGLAAVAIAVPIGVAIAFPAYVRPAAATLGLLPLALAGVWAIRQEQWRLGPPILLVAMLALHALFYRVGSPYVDEFSSLRRPAEIARELPDDTAIFAYKTRGHSFGFYDGRVITRLRSPEAVAAVLESAAPVALLTKRKYLERLRCRLAVPASIWWEGASGRVLITNVGTRESADLL